MTYYTGAPVWAFQGWVGNFFPKGTRPSDFLREYANRLTAVEGNTTFYAVPAPATVVHWREETPESFRFCLKLPRSVSHAGPLMPRLREALDFLELMRGLGPRLGPLFLQLPPRYSPQLYDDLRAFLEAWPRDTQIAVEVRHLDWFEKPHHDRLVEALRARDAARVLIDTRPIRDLPEDAIGEGSVYARMSERLERTRQRKPNVPLIRERTASFVMLRYIGHPAVEANAPLLDGWAAQLTDWLKEGADAYVFCHSPDQTEAPLICRELHRRVSARAPIDPLPWDEPDDVPEQGRLL